MTSDYDKECNEHLRTRSGCRFTESRLISFLYELMRDHVTPGVLEQVRRSSPAGRTELSNGYLADYAAYLAETLGVPSSVPVDKASLYSLNDKRRIILSLFKNARSWELLQKDLNSIFGFSLVYERGELRLRDQNGQSAGKSTDYGMSYSELMNRIGQFPDQPLAEPRDKRVAKGGGYGE